MSLSKKNLDKLDPLKKKLENNKSSHHANSINRNPKVIDPKIIFYSIIDNSDNINETAQANDLLREIEKKHNHTNPREGSCSGHLSIEDQLYDEFNYLLDE